MVPFCSALVVPSYSALDTPSCTRFQDPPVAKSLCCLCREAPINTHHEGAFVGYIVLSKLRTDCASVHISSQLHFRICPLLVA